MGANRTSLLCRSEPKLRMPSVGKVPTGGFFAPALHP